MSQIAPVSLGVINMNVTIGGVSPTRRRNRQAFTYGFNQSSLSMFNFRDKDRTEAIGDSETGEFGIALKGFNPYEHHNWLAFIGENPTSEGVAQNFSTFGSEASSWVNPGLSQYEQRTEGEISFYSAEGSYEWNNINAAKVEHFMFIPDGSIFRAGLNSESEAKAEADKFSAESGMSEKMYSFYRKFVPYHREVLIPGAHVDSGNSDILCAPKDWFKRITETNVNANLPPDTEISKTQSFNNAPQEYCPVSKVEEDGENICVQTSGKRNITFDNVFTDTVVDQDPRLWPEVRDTYRHPTAKGNYFGESVDKKRSLIANYVNPGIHVKYRKYSPVFRGMDFEIAFKSMAKEPAVARTAANDNDQTTMLWALRDHYEIIDAARSPNFSNIGPGQPSSLPVNNAVCYVGKDQKRKTVVSSASAGYYLAEQPYVIIEIDGGKENRYFLLIPERGNVIFCEGTYDPEIIDYVDENETVQGTGLGAKKLVQRNLYHSRVLQDFGFPGKQLLSKDSFVVRFQHIGGKLAISFGHESNLYIISRYRWTNAFSSSTGESLEETRRAITSRQLNSFDRPQCEDFSAWRSKNPNLSRDAAPIMMEGNLNVFMGNKKLAFIFSPLKYPDFASISPELPAGILGLEGQASAVNILLRSRGGPERPNVISNNAEKGGIIENEDGPITFTSPLTVLATRNIAHNYAQVINGERHNFSHLDLSVDFRSVIPLDTAHTTSSISSNIFQIAKSEWHTISKPTALVTSYSLRSVKEMVNHVSPAVVMESGSVALLPVSKTKEQSGQALILSNCIRPILKDFELLISEGGSENPMFQSEAVDVVGKVIRYSEQMVEQNRETIRHTASLDLFLNFESASRVLELISRIRVNDLPTSANAQQGNNSPRGSEILGGTSTANAVATDDFLASLQDKYFYLRIRAHRSPDTAGTYVNYPGWFWGTKDNKVPDGVNDVLFTGLCVKTAFTVEAKGVRMTCTLADYSEILENSFWIQPTFYDAMRDYNAVMDVLTQAGFYAGERDPMYDPAALVKRLAESSSKEEYYTIDYDGEEILVNDYVLPGSYDMLQSPRFKASKFEPYINILSKMAKVSGKIVYFDRLGVMHFDIPEDELENMQKINASSERKNLYEAPIYDKFSVTMKPKNNPVRSEASSPASVGSTPPSSVQVDTFNTSTVQDVNWWNVVTGISYSFSRMTDNVRNEIRIYSSSPDMTLKTASHLNASSMYDPTKPGFIGYRKMFVQKSGFFGSTEAVKKMASRYTTMMNPPVEATFQIVGRIGLRPMQTVILDGIGPGSFKLLLREVSNEIDPKSNTWFSTIRGRYLMPAERIEFRQKNTYELRV
jgi:hypothetical protein